MNYRLPLPLVVLALFTLLLPACARTNHSTLTELWTLHDPDQLLIPESVVIELNDPALYVSNGVVGNGRISKLSLDGIHPDGPGGYSLTPFLGGEIVHLGADGRGEILGVYESPMELDVDLDAGRLYVPAKWGEEGIVMGLELRGGPSQ